MCYVMLHLLEMLLAHTVSNLWKEVAALEPQEMSDEEQVWDSDGIAELLQSDLANCARLPSFEEMNVMF